ncbi:MAG: 50S ribosomal protein L23 [Bacteriovoracaceae bacterium]|jgi:large subunit ribosomal protein L23|nr:50S ribosomal protein L23 [Halobacteriovoraceae bacterium]MDP7321754.1 50S ribosomal protein L23 [Bacteriovoracaceae bacterium]|tara:strand:+ start:152 stop:439 length:288 start_codon:yes stop_codon:yes gene_type:complete
MHVEQVLIKPLLTEKSSIETENTNRYVFKVQRKANKYQIKDAVEAMFDVKVVDVKTAVLPGKVKRAGRLTKKSSSWKKAYIKIQDGQKLELFQGI